MPTASLLSLLTFSVAIFPGLPSQRSSVAVAASDPALARVCAQILRASQQHDFALLLELLDEDVDIEPHGTLKRSDVPTLIETWPEDFGPAFWRDLADVVQRGVADVDDDHIWRRSGTVLQFRRSLESAEWRIGTILRRVTPRTKILPVDVAASDPELAAVRAQVMRAVARRDPEMLLPIAAPKILVD